MTSAFRVHQIMLRFAESLTDPPGGDPGYIDRIKAARRMSGRSAWIGPEHPCYAFTLDMLVRFLKPERVLEVGFQSGGSAWGLLQSLKPGATFHVVDNEDSEHAVAAWADFQTVCTHPGATYEKGDIHRVIPFLGPRPYDLIHLDHYKPDYLPTLDQLLRFGLLKETTVVAFHDTELLAAPFTAGITARFGSHVTLAVEGGAHVCWHPILEAP